MRLCLVACLPAGFMSRRGSTSIKAHTSSQETGNVEIDGFLQESIGADNLILYPPGNGDLAGLVFNGQLQTHSHFPDLRGHANGASLIKELRRHIRNLVSVTEIDRTAPLSEVAESRFGSEYVQLIMAPVLEKAYGISLDRLAGFAMLLPGLSRLSTMRLGGSIRRTICDIVPWQDSLTRCDCRRLIGMNAVAFTPAITAHVP
jgi:hypothetical protein